MARILHLISQLEEGGAQRLLANLLAFPNKHQVEVASLIASPEERLFPFFRAAQIPIHFLSHSMDFYAPEILPSLTKLIASRKYDIVQCWLFESIVQGVVAARQCKVRSIAFPHSMLALLSMNRHRLWEQFLIRKLIKKADLVLFPSASSAIDYVDQRWVAVNRVRIARNGVDCDFFQPSGTGDAVVCVGRLSSEKGLDLLGGILSRLRQTSPDVRCIVAGGGDGKIPTGIESTGFVEDIRKVYRQAAVYLSASLTEGMSLALLESQAMGIPAVVRKVGGNSEVVTHGVNGFLAESEDQFVEMCQLLLRDSSLRSQMGKNAREKMVSEFSFQKQVELLVSVIDELL